MPLLAAIVVLLLVLAGTITALADAKTWERFPLRGHSNGVEVRYPGCNTYACVGRVRAKARARAIRRLTPYRCSFGRSAIPCAIVRCESGGSWEALNPSGAAGRYQLMPVHRRPWPANTPRARLAHHKIAARLFRSSGTGPWVSSRHCWG